MTGEALPRTPSFSLEGRRALVTGASRGIGFASAAALASAGAHVVLAARSAGDLDDAVSLLRADGASAESLPVDVTDTRATRLALDALPAFDILVNSAGMNRPRSFLDVTEDGYDSIMTINLRAAFFTTQHVAARMVADGIRGSIITISSQMGHVGGALRGVYCASKWGVEGMSKAIAIDLAPHGIRSNTVAPTFIETALAAQSLADPDYRRLVLSKIKLGRLGQVEDVMGGIVFLASDASALMTGTSIVIDGGWTAG